VNDDEVARATLSHVKNVLETIKFN
jgi:hypothetical protein